MVCYCYFSKHPIKIKINPLDREGLFFLFYLGSVKLCQNRHCLKRAVWPSKCTPLECRHNRIESSCWWSKLGPFGSFKQSSRPPIMNRSQHKIIMVRFSKYKCNMTHPILICSSLHYHFSTYLLVIFYFIYM